MVPLSHSTSVDFAEKPGLTFTVTVWYQKVATGSPQTFVSLDRTSPVPSAFPQCSSPWAAWWISTQVYEQKKIFLQRILNTMLHIEPRKLSWRQKQATTCDVLTVPPWPKRRMLPGHTHHCLLFATKTPGFLQSCFPLSRQLLCSSLSLSQVQDFECSTSQYHHVKDKIKITMLLLPVSIKLNCSFISKRSGKAQV